MRSDFSLNNSNNNSNSNNSNSWNNIGKERRYKIYLYVQRKKEETKYDKTPL